MGALINLQFCLLRYFRLIDFITFKESFYKFFNIFSLSLDFVKLIIRKFYSILHWPINSYMSQKREEKKPRGNNAGNLMVN